MQLYFDVPMKYAHRGVRVVKYDVGLHDIDDPELIRQAQELGYAAAYPRQVHGLFVATPVWKGPVVVMASGPSLTQEDADYVRGKAPCIVVNDAYRMAPWADMLYASDPEWWEHHQGVKDFKGLRVTRDRNGGQAAAAKWRLHPIRLEHNGRGFSRDPAVIHSGNNSGFQAMNLAVLMGGTKIILLGYDMQGQTHFFGDHPTVRLKRKHNYPLWLRRFDEVEQHGFEIVNCSRQTAITQFRRAALRSELA